MNEILSDQKLIEKGYYISDLRKNKIHEKMKSIDENQHNFIEYMKNSNQIDLMKYRSNLNRLNENIEIKLHNFQENSEFINNINEYNSNFKRNYFDNFSVNNTENDRGIVNFSINSKDNYGSENNGKLKNDLLINKKSKYVNTFINAKNTKYEKDASSIFYDNYNTLNSRSFNRNYSQINFLGGNSNRLEHQSK